MDDRMKETLSAMLDDEADELSVRRILTQSDAGGVRDQWARWQRISDRLSTQRRDWAHIDVLDAVNQSLDQQTENSAPMRTPAAVLQNRARRVYRWPFAAMLVVSLGLGFGAGLQWEDGASAAGAMFSTTQPPAAQTEVAGSREALEPVRDLPLSAMDDRQRRQFNGYLLRHAQHNNLASGKGALGFARAASFSTSE